MPAATHRTDLGHGFLQRTKCGLAALPARIIQSLARRFEYRRQMRQLAELDDHLLSDIGLPSALRWRGPVLGGLRRDPSNKP